MRTFSFWPFGKITNLLHFWGMKTKQNVDLLVIIGARIRHIRKIRGLTQSDLAASLKLSRPSIINIERGRHSLSMQSLVSLCKIFKCNYSDILPDVENYGKALAEAEYMKKNEVLIKQKTKEFNERINKMRKEFNEQLKDILNVFEVSTEQKGAISEI